MSETPNDIQRAAKVTLWKIVDEYEAANRCGAAFWSGDAVLEILGRAILAERQRLDEVREELRLLMLKQPTTGNRDTYSDGFQQGLAAAIGVIDAALATPAPEAQG